MHGAEAPWTPGLSLGAVRKQMLSRKGDQIPKSLVRSNYGEWTKSALSEPRAWILPCGLSVRPFCPTNFLTLLGFKDPTQGLPGKGKDWGKEPRGMVSCVGAGRLSLWSASGQMGLPPTLPRPSPA